MKHKNKTAIVTGATRGIGKAIAIALADLNYNVVGVYEKSKNKAKQIEKQYPNIKLLKADIGSKEKIRRVINYTADKYGAIDILINNAGINLWGPIKDYSLKDWNRMLDVNLTSKFLFSKYAIPFLEKSDNGVIINISSRAGINKFVFADFIAYCVNNAGINNFTVALAKELKPKGIRVNAVIPTVTDTDRFKKAFTKEEKEEIIKAGKLGTPEEVADLVISLIKDKTKTGEILIDKRVFIKSEA